MANGKNKPNVGRRRRFRGNGSLLQPIFAALTSASNRAIGVVILLFTVLVTINYKSDETNNWITTIITKIKNNASWSWLGKYLLDRKLQIVHSCWLITAAFLSSPANRALLLGALLSLVTLAVNKTTDRDVILQSIILFAVTAIRKRIYKYLIIIIAILLIIQGHVFVKWSL